MERIRIFVGLSGRGFKGTSKNLILSKLFCIFRGSLKAGYDTIFFFKTRNIMKKIIILIISSLYLLSMQLKEAGNDAYGTIQEVMYKLQENKNTNWSKVNLEALRLHLIDMYDMTFSVNVIEQKHITNGLAIRVMPTTSRSSIALKKIFSAHAGMLEKESGFNVGITHDKEYDVYSLKVTTNNKNRIDEIRGLGYIGLMAYGKHHQPHHWAIATGSNPHAGHNMHH